MGPKQEEDFVVNVGVDGVERLLDRGLVLFLVNQLIIDLIEESRVDRKRLLDHLAPRHFVVEQHFNRGKMLNGVHDPEEAVGHIFTRTKPLSRLSQRAKRGAARGHQAHLPVARTDGLDIHMSWLISSNAAAP